MEDEERKAFINRLVNVGCAGIDKINAAGSDEEVCNIYITRLQKILEK